MDVTALVLLLLGLGAGLGVGVVLGRATREPAAAQSARALAERDALRGESERLAADRDRLEERARTAERELAAVTATLDAERVAGAQRLADLQQSQADLAERFRALSQEALDRSQQRLAEFAEERLKAGREQASADLEQRKQAVEHLVAPLKESLSKVEQQLGEVEKARTEAYADLRRQVATMNETSAALRTETAQLVTALRAPQVRGRWGELQLRRVVEASGMVEHCDFVEQESVATDDGVVRPDLVVHLAGGKHVVVDSKVAFNGYLEAMEARDEGQRADRLKAHARHLRAHIDALGSKAYWEHFDPSPEFVVMFVPAEVFLNAALEEDPTLLEHAFERGVVIATPQTLVALLRTVGYAWRQESVARNAREVYQLGRELHGRLSVLGGHVAKLGNQLNGAVSAYNKTVSSLESRVLVSARRLSDLKVVETDLEQPGQVELRAVTPQAPELVAAASQSLVGIDELETDDRYGVDVPAAMPGAGTLGA
ncbi:MAG TPA: DNA recombination protein RmuC [Actinomycetes bacterium]|nr:DNA recombination protein RmuC [Actinomycetes bacterium]